MRRQLVRARALPILLALALLCAAACGPSARPAPEDGQATATAAASLEIRGRPVELELALTPEVQARGLGYRDALAWNHGMLFVYARPAFQRFWMRGMRFDIDIVWIRGDRIVDISHSVPHQPGGDGPTVSPRELCDRVLEVPAGYALAHGWRPGDRVRYAGAAAR
jgi:hypothetical protein